jgi:hypothetical protein
MMHWPVNLQLGKFWKLRLAAWLLVLAICLVLWPVGGAILEERHLINPHLTPNIKPNPPVGPPLVYWKRSQGAFVWDWRTGRHHRLPVAGKGEGICGVVDQLAIAENRAGEGVVITDLESPFAQRHYAVPAEVNDATLLTVADSERLALFAAFEQDGLIVTLVDLKANRVVDRMTSYHSHVLSKGLTCPVARPDNSGSKHIASRWTIDPATDQIVADLSDTAPDFMSSWIECLGLRVPNLAGGRQLQNAKFTNLPNVYDFQIHSPLRGPIKLPTKLGFHAARSTTSEDQFVTLDSENSLQVWDVATMAVVAEDRITPQRFWFRTLVVVLSLLAMALSLGTMIRESSLDWLLLDATPFLVITGSAGFACGGGWPWLGSVSIVLALVGAVYIVFGSKKGWLPLALRAVSYVLYFTVLGVLFHVLTVAGLGMEIPYADLSFREELTALVKSGIALPSIVVLCFSLARWRGWTIGLGGTPGARGSFQFGLRTILAVTFLIALYVGVWRICSATNTELGEEVLKGTVACSFFSLLGLFFTWLQMTNHRWWLVWMALVFLPLTCLIVAGCLFEPQPVLVFAMGILPLAFSLLMFCLRLNGYRWVRDGKAGSPVIEPT